MDAQKGSPILEFGEPVVVAPLKSAAADEFALGTHAVVVQARSLPMEETTSPLPGEAEIQDEQPIDPQRETMRDSIQGLVPDEEGERLTKTRNKRLTKLHADRFDYSFHDANCFGVLEDLVSFAPQVCLILLRNRDGRDIPYGSGFYVGKSFILTAKHVGNPVEGAIQLHKFVTPLELSANFCFESKNLKHEKNIKLTQSSKVVVGGDLDAIFLEVDEQQARTPGAELPPQGFALEDLDFGTGLPKCVHVISHFNVEVKNIDRNCRVEQPAHISEQLDSYYSYSWLDQPPASRQDDSRRNVNDHQLIKADSHIWITGWFLFGASGSPMLHFCEGKVKVVGMFCLGLPSGHYERRRTKPEQEKFDKDMQQYYATFEGGLKLSAIRDAMKWTSGKNLLGW